MVLNIRYAMDVIIIAVVLYCIYIVLCFKSLSLSLHSCWSLQEDETGKKGRTARNGTAAKWN